MTISARPLKKVSELRNGDIVRSVGSANSYVVISTNGSRAQAVRCVEISNPEEWLLIEVEGR